jgi:hypothetical protein
MSPICRELPGFLGVARGTILAETILRAIFATADMKISPPAFGSLLLSACPNGELVAHKGRRSVSELTAAIDRRISVSDCAIRFMRNMGRDPLPTVGPE